jgi:hypothetical protein
VVAATILYITAEDGNEKGSASRQGLDQGLRTTDAIQVSPLLGSEGWGAVVSGHF